MYTHPPGHRPPDDDDLIFHVVLHIHPIAVLTLVLVGAVVGAALHAWSWS